MVAAAGVEKSDLKVKVTIIEAEKSTLKVGRDNLRDHTQQLDGRVDAHN